MGLRVLTVFGTRPEAIKMAPVVRALAATGGVEAAVCVTAQHRSMLDQVLGLFRIAPQFDLDIMTPGQSLADVTCAVLRGLEPVLDAFRPDWVLVQGDTTTSMAAAMAAFYRRIRVGHVEAGLRTYDLQNPWPEEMNRRVVDVLTALLFAPTDMAAQNLLREGFPAERIVVTGNTVVDALADMVAALERDPERKAGLERKFAYLDPSRRLILITGHRRESFGAGFERICKAIAQVARRKDVQLLYPVHLNPQVQQAVRSLLGNIANVHLIEPVDYLSFVYLMTRAYLILSDSGGIQEETPTLRKPLLVMRDVTERMEAVQAGSARLVGTDVERIVSSAEELLDDAALYERMANVPNPFGDGRAAQRIVRALQDRAGP